MFLLMSLAAKTNTKMSQISHNVAQIPSEAAGGDSLGCRISLHQPDYNQSSLAKATHAFRVAGDAADAQPAPSHFRFSRVQREL